MLVFQVGSVISLDTYEVAMGFVKRLIASY